MGEALQTEQYVSKIPERFKPGPEIHSAKFMTLSDRTDETVVFKAVSIWLSELEEQKFKLLVDFFVQPQTTGEEGRAILYVLRFDCNRFRSELEEKAIEAFDAGEKYLEISDGTNPEVRFNFQISAEVRDAILGKIDQYRRITRCESM